MRCRDLHRLANTAFLGQFLFPALPRVALYCVPGGVGVVSIEAHSCLTIVKVSPTPTEPSKLTPASSKKFSSSSRLFPKGSWSTSPGVAPLGVLGEDRNPGPEVTQRHQEKVEDLLWGA